MDGRRDHGRSDPDRASCSVFHAGLPPAPGWLSQWLLWPQAAAAPLSGFGDKGFSTWCLGFLLGCFWLPFAWSHRQFFLLSLSVISLWLLLFLLPLILISFHFSSFSSFSFPVSLAFLSCFLPKCMHHFLAFWSFSEGLDHSRSICMAICVAQSHLPQLRVLCWGWWPSLAPSVVTGERQEPQ